MRITQTDRPDSTPRASESPNDSTNRRGSTPPQGTAAQAQIREQLPSSFLGKRERSTSSEASRTAPLSQRLRVGGSPQRVASGGPNAPAARAIGASTHVVSEPELVGPVMLTNVRHYEDGSSMGEIDPHDEDTRNELVSFLLDVEVEDRGALAARFEQDYLPDTFDPSIYGGMVVAVKDDMIAGFMDYSKTELHDPQRVAQINILVAKDHRGTEVARNLAKQVDEVLIAKGYRYKFSHVWESNTAQLERKETRGWRLDPALGKGGRTKAFWIALDPRFKDIPPPKLNTDHRRVEGGGSASQDRAA